MKDVPRFILRHKIHNSIRMEGRSSFFWQDILAGLATLLSNAPTQSAQQSCHCPPKFGRTSSQISMGGRLGGHFGRTGGHLGGHFGRTFLYVEMM